MPLVPRNPHFVPQNGLKCNITYITAHKLRQRDVNHLLKRLWVLIEHPDTNYMQQYMNNMTLRIRNLLFDPQNELKYNISSITAHKFRQSDVNHILIYCAYHWDILKVFTWKNICKICS